MVINYIILAVYILMMVVIAFYTRNRSATLNDFLLAGKGMGGWMTAFAYGTTYFSSVIFIGYAGNLGWNFGLAVAWIGLGNAILGSFVPWKVLAKRTKNLTKMLGSRTMPEYFEQRFESKWIKCVSSIVIFLFLIPYSASVYQGLAYLFESVFSIDFVWCILIMAVLTALYLFFGGYFATALTDFIQGIIMLGGVVVMIVCVLSSDSVKFVEGFKALTEQGFGFIPAAGNDFWSSPFVNIFSLFLLTSFGVWGLPQIVHKFYAIRDGGAIRRATVVSTFFALIVGVCAYLIGGVSRLFFDTAAQPPVDTIVPDILTRVLPEGLLGLVVVLVLSASMSTLASLSLAGASAMTVDFYKGYLKKDADDKKVNILTRIVCLVFVALSAVFAICEFDVIVVMMSLSWGVLAGCFIGPYVLSLYSKKITKTGCWASVIGCLAVTLALILVFGFSLSEPGAGLGIVLKTGIGKSPIIGVVCMALSPIITYVVSCFTKKPSEELLNNLFEHVKDEL